MPKDTVRRRFIVKLCRETCPQAIIRTYLHAGAGNPLAGTLELSQTICVPIFRQNGRYEVSI